MDKVTLDFLYSHHPYSVSRVRNHHSMMLESPHHLACVFALEPWIPTRNLLPTTPHQQACSPYMIRPLSSMFWDKGSVDKHQFLSTADHPAVQKVATQDKGEPMHASACWDR